MNNEPHPVLMTIVAASAVVERILFWLQKIPQELAPFIAIASFIGATVSAAYWCRKFWRERKRK